ncbi:MAG: nicotinate (nicotinamide) nucleotide adenylyltransferase [Chloroflexi bacterium]|nr:MAG: nicotinate (nicotinamide) nucleotide adenylyltransferase [Chloroflexota bacterium]
MVPTVGRRCGFPMWSFSTIPSADIGILGGTFDPVHNGHLAAARQLLGVANLDQVWLMPNATPPHRTAVPVAPADDRMRMVELAVAGQNGVLASRTEVDRGGISYTIDTIRQLAREYPRQRFAFLIGSDAALQIRSWHDAEALLAEGYFVIFNRPETALAIETLRELGFVPARSRIVHLDTPAIAAHQVRDRVARGAPIDDLVPSAVADFIRTHELYQV